MLQDNNNYY